MLVRRYTRGGLIGLDLSANASPGGLVGLFDLSTKASFLGDAAGRAATVMVRVKRARRLIGFIMGGGGEGVV